MKGYPRLSETFIAQELRALEQAGLPLRIIALRRPHDKARHPIHDEMAAPVHYLPEYLHTQPLRVMRGLIHALTRRAFWPAARQLLKDLRKDRSRNRLRRFGQACVLTREFGDASPSIYVHFAHTPASVAHYASLLTGKSWSCSAHAKDIYTSPDWDLRGKLAAMAWLATCTAANVAHLRALAPGFADKVHLIYHGLDVERLNAAAPCTCQDHAVAGAPERAGPLRILSVGRLVEKKGYDDLLDALAQLPPSLDWHFDHIGGGALQTHLHTRASDLELTDRITWHGAQAQGDVLRAYRKADIFILASRVADDGDRDGLPNVLMEAQSQSLACISTRVSAIPELIIDGQTGLLVAPGAPQELADTIIRLAGDRTLLATLGAAGQARVRTAFSHTHGVEQLLALFKADPAVAALFRHGQPSGGDQSTPHTQGTYGAAPTSMRSDGATKHVPANPAAAA
ncbi:MAG: glycosyltransferase family 4 protein [Pseudomonadota bacterium]